MAAEKESHPVLLSRFWFLQLRGWGCLSESVKKKMCNKNLF